VFLTADVGSDSGYNAGPDLFWADQIVGFLLEDSFATPSFELESFAFDRGLDAGSEFVESMSAS
jgi:hypothetical protein